MYTSALAKSFAATRLGLDPEKVPSSIGIELDAIARRYAARFDCIGSLPEQWDSLSDTDRAWFDEAVGLATAARLIGPLSTGGAPSDLTAVKRGDFQASFSGQKGGGGAPGDAGAGPGGYSGPNERVRWLREAAEALGRVSGVRAYLSQRASSFKMFVLSGPTRAARDAGHVQTLQSMVIRLLSDDWENTDPAA